MSRIKKIGFVTNEFVPFDAICNYICALAKQLNGSFYLSIFTFTLSDSFAEKCLPKRNIDVNFCASSQGRTLWHEIETIMFPVHLAKELLKNDVLLILTDRPPLVPILLAKTMKPTLKLILDFHGITPPDYHRNIRRHFIEIFRMAVIKQLMKYCDFRIVHSNFMKTEVQRLFGRDSVVFPLEVDTIRFQPKVRRKFEENGRHDRFNLLYVGRLVPHKRVDFIIRAIALLKDHSVNFFIVGTGPERGKLENMVKSLNLTDHVFFMGAIPDEDLPDFFSASDAFVTASLHEGVCVPILEALATGKPAIVPDNTAMPETMENGGLVYASNSVRDLADKIKLLKNDENLRSNLKKNALAIAAKRSIGKTPVMYESFLKEIMKN